MDYGKYKQARNASWQCIIDYKIDRLPIKITDIIKQAYNIKLYKNSKVDILPDNKSGMTIYKDNVFYIVYNDLDIPARCRFSIAHEYGHIVLGHVMIDTPIYRTFATADDTERSANVFARDLLAPACVLHEIGAVTAEQIMQVCNISYSAASIRSERMQKLMRRNKLYADPLELQVKRQFQDFINSYK
ncbi:MAG: ImmA/IrrE family metallo-endopeptidase [Acutalibacteraceae bacterium]